MLKIMDQLNTDAEIKLKPFNEDIERAKNEI